MRAFFKTPFAIKKHAVKKEVTVSCPFHDDHSPSFSVNLDTGLWVSRGLWSGHTSGPGGSDARHHASRQQYQARKERAHEVKDCRAMANVIPIEAMPEKGGATATAGSEERFTDSLAA